MRRILVTGASGFVGTALSHTLMAAGYAVRRAVRTVTVRNAALDEDTVAVGDLGPDTVWERALDGVDAVVHLAARAHVMRDATSDPLAEYRRINVLATEGLARAAADVRRLVFVSSIKVNGEQTGAAPFSEADVPQPQDAYGLSKWEAEQALWRVTAGSTLEGVVLRPPLLYGPGVKGNFLRLLKAVDLGVPLPLAQAGNKRSLLFLGNLVNAIITCLTDPQASGRTYLVSDGEDISTAELISRIARALDKPARLWPLPPGLMRLVGKTTGKSEEIDRLFNPLTIDSSRIRQELAWSPPYSMNEGLGETVKWFRVQLNQSYHP